MTLFSDTPKLEDQPIVTTKYWRTYAIDGELYLVCEIPETKAMRTTSAIVKSDPEKQEFTTTSGRVYNCIGPMAENTIIMRTALFLNGYIDDVDTCVSEPDTLH